MVFASFIKEEKGDILVISVIMLTSIIIFISLSCDVGMMYMQRARILETAQLMRDTRFDEEAGNAPLMNSDTPGKFSFLEMNNIARLNDFNGIVEIVYYEYKSSYKERKYKVRITLSDIYECTTLRLFGFNKIPIDVVIDGSGKKTGLVWRPLYLDNGTYTSNGSTNGYRYSSAIPRDMIEY